MEKQEQSKLIYWLLGILIALVSTIWGYTTLNQATAIAKVQEELNSHETSQANLNADIATLKTDIGWIKDAMKANGIQPSKSATMK